MNEVDFRQQLFNWRMQPKPAIIPTTASIRLYGQQAKTRIIQTEHEHLIYACIKPLEISDDLYKKLTEEMHLDDVGALKFVQDTYQQYLVDIRKQIVKLQKNWSKNYAHFRAKLVINELKYDSIFHICDLTNERLVPIELILKTIFSIHSGYGEHRRIKDKSEIYVDPRVLQMYEDRKKEAERHAEYIKKYYSDKQIVSTQES